MQINQILAPERVRVDSGATSKKSVLEELASMIANEEEGVARGEVFESFIARERLGSTRVSEGQRRHERRTVVFATVHARSRGNRMPSTSARPVSAMCSPSCADSS